MVLGAYTHIHTQVHTFAKESNSKKPDVLAVPGLKIGQAVNYSYSRS